jgi:hypothetical protein
MISLRKISNEGRVKQVWDRESRSSQELLGAGDEIWLGSLP